MSGSPFKFTGEMMDANDLVYLRARYYHPGVGVFPSLDPVEGSVQQPISLNRYSYVQANPTNRLDPSGLKNCPYWYQGYAVDLLPHPVPGQFFSFAYLHSINCMECTSLCVTINQNCLTGDRGFLLGVDPIHGDIRGMSECETKCQEMFPGQSCYPTMGPLIDLGCIIEPVRSILNSIKPANTDFVLGVRLDASAIALIGADVNLEYYCTVSGWVESLAEPLELIGYSLDLGGRCGYFLNIGVEAGPEATYGTNVGGLIGFTNFPDEPGEYSIVTTVGASAAAGPGIEGDITVNPSDLGYVLFIGGGGGVGGGGYGDYAISIYLGSTKKEADQMLLEVISHLDDYWFPNTEQ